MPNPIKIKSYVDTLINHGDNVYSVFFRTKERFPRFKPGQFLHLAVDPFDPVSGYWPESRVFSIASCPGQDSVRIIYSVKGKYTKKMESYLRQGSEVWLKFPYGDFIIDAVAGMDREIVLIAGGTGITPYVPFLESQLAGNSTNRRIMLFYGIRKNSLLLVGDLLNKCKQNLAQLKIELSVENDSEGSQSKTLFERKPGPLKMSDIFQKTKKLNNPLYFVSGPPGMIASFKQSLATAGVPSDSIKTDEWE
jgi:ferredoxin-NADP reductase